MSLLAGLNEILGLSNDPQPQPPADSPADTQPPAAPQTQALISPQVAQSANIPAPQPTYADVYNQAYSGQGAQPGKPDADPQAAQEAKTASIWTRAADSINNFLKQQAPIIQSNYDQISGKTDRPTPQALALSEQETPAFNTFTHSYADTVNSLPNLGIAAANLTGRRADGTTAYKIPQLPTLTTAQEQQQHPWASGAGTALGIAAQLPGAYDEVPAIAKNLFTGGQKLASWGKAIVGTGSAMGTGAGIITPLANEATQEQQGNYNAPLSWQGAGKNAVWAAPFGVLGAARAPKSKIPLGDDGKPIRVNPADVLGPNMPGRPLSADELNAPYGTQAPVGGMPDRFTQQQGQSAQANAAPQAASPSVADIQAEQAHAQAAHDQAYQAVMNNPTPQNQAAYAAARQRLWDANSAAQKASDAAYDERAQASDNAFAGSEPYRQPTEADVQAQMAKQGQPNAAPQEATNSANAGGQAAQAAADTANTAGADNGQASYGHSQSAPYSDVVNRALPYLKDALGGDFAGKAKDMEGDLLGQMTNDRYNYVTATHPNDPVAGGVFNDLFNLPDGKGGKTGGDPERTFANLMQANQDRLKGMKAQADQLTKAAKMAPGNQNLAALRDKATGDYIAELERQNNPNYQPYAREAIGRLSDWTKMQDSFEPGGSQWGNNSMALYGREAGAARGGASEATVAKNAAINKADDLPDQRTAWRIGAALNQAVGDGKLTLAEAQQLYRDMAQGNWDNMGTGNSPTGADLTRGTMNDAKTGTGAPRTDAEMNAQGAFMRGAVPRMENKQSAAPNISGDSAFGSMSPEQVAALQDVQARAAKGDFSIDPKSALTEAQQKAAQQAMQESQSKTGKALGAIGNKGGAGVDAVNAAVTAFDPKLGAILEGARAGARWAAPYFKNRALDLTKDADLAEYARRLQNAGEFAGEMAGAKKIRSGASVMAEDTARAVGRGAAGGALGAAAGSSFNDKVNNAAQAVMSYQPSDDDRQLGNQIAAAFPRQDPGDSKIARLIEALGMGAAGALAGSRNVAFNPYAADEAEDLQKKYGMSFGQALSLANNPQQMNDFSKTMAMYGNSMSPEAANLINQTSGDYQKAQQDAGILSQLEQMGKNNALPMGGLLGNALTGIEDKINPSGAQNMAHQQVKQLLGQLSPELSAGISDNDSADVLNAKIQRAIALNNQRMGLIQERQKQAAALHTGKYGGSPQAFNNAWAARQQ